MIFFSVLVTYFFFQPFPRLPPPPTLFSFNFLPSALFSSIFIFAFYSSPSPSPYHVAVCLSSQLSFCHYLNPCSLPYSPLSVLCFPLCSFFIILHLLLFSSRLSCVPLFRSCFLYLILSFFSSIANRTFLSLPFCCCFLFRGVLFFFLGFLVIFQLFSFIFLSLFLCFRLVILPLQIVFFSFIFYLFFCHFNLLLFSLLTILNFTSIFYSSFSYILISTFPHYFFPLIVIQQSPKLIPFYISSILNSYFLISFHLSPFLIFCSDFLLSSYFFLFLPL